MCSLYDTIIVCIICWMYVCMCTSVCGVCCLCVHATVCLWRSENILVRVDSYLPPCGSWEPKSGCQAWPRTPSQVLCHPGNPNPQWLVLCDLFCCDIPCSGLRLGHTRECTGFVLELTGKWCWKHCFVSTWREEIQTASVFWSGWDRWGDGRVVRGNLASDRGDFRHIHEQRLLL